MLILLSALLSTLSSMFRSALRWSWNMSPCGIRSGPEALRREAAEADCRRPSVLGFPLAGLVRLALGAGHLQARDGDRLASQGISPFLDLEDPAWPGGSARRLPRGPRSDPQDEPRERALGRTPYPRGIAETGHRD